MAVEAITSCDPCASEPRVLFHRRCENVRCRRRVGGANVIFSVVGTGVSRGTCFAAPTGTVDYVRSIEDVGPLIVTLMNQHGMAS